MLRDQFRVMPFGLSNAPATFQRMMDILLAGLKWNTCLVYLDDIVIFSQTVPENLSRLETILLRFRKAGLKLKLSKCSFLATHLKVLGYIVSGAGLSPDPAKIEAVQKFPVPSTRLKDVQSFIGLCSYYRKFIQNFAVLARPLTNLTRKNTPFRWTKEHQSSFHALKKALLSPPILGHPNYNLPMEIHCDACGFGLGAVLVQRQEAERVILYASRLMNRAETNYSVSEQECLALIFAVNRFKPYLWGMKVRVLTDHHALCWLMKKRDLAGRLVRWSLQLQDLDLEIVHRSGRLHSDADALSRNPVSPPEDTPEIPLLSLQTIDKRSVKIEQETSNWWSPIIAGLKEENPTNSIRKLIRHYEIREGLLYHRVIGEGRAYYRLCLTPTLVEEVYSTPVSKSGNRPYRPFPSLSFEKQVRHRSSRLLDQMGNCSTGTMRKN
ncbi:pol polyprotein [Daphnia sinensis]|uniref:RNA-directed DNA polymerase n=1 Tax=Daphnia sinensis TaxID=1820382 RepID=A0AAD5PSC0_9CRUS|nr:pol polyprotein [Daphnia sinensis]